MKIPLSWISLYSDVWSLLVDKWVKELAHLYSIHTAEIDGIEQVGAEEKVVVAKVLSTRPHPDSDHLNLVEIDCGPLGVKHIVCGATNVVGAKYVPVATVGARLWPARDFEIKLSKIRGEVSEGMICSEDELGLQEDRAPGIMRLEDSFDESYLETRLGTPFYDLKVSIPGNGTESYDFPLADTIFEIDNKFITNRPDLFAVRGNAREFGAIFSLPFADYPSRVIKTSEAVPVKIESKNVLAYSLLSFRGLKVQKSPLGIDQMLRRSGVSPKYDLVDITNFIMTELGQPMHIFDADTISGSIVVREAHDGEKLFALDGKEYTLTSKDLVIADEEKVLAIAGIIGGMSSAVTENTKNAIFEAATFDPVCVRLTSQRIGLRTDASMRFEKSMDPLLPERVLSRVIDLLAFLGKTSTPVASSHYLDASRVQDISISTDIGFITRKLGIDIPKASVGDILTRLGFESSFAGDSFTVKVPSWRATKDVSIKEDIAEEIGRIYGYDKIENTPVFGPFSIAAGNQSIALRDAINTYFSGRGWYETYNYSFSSLAKDQKIGLTSDSDAVHIKNSFNVEYTHMRRSLMPNLLSVAAENCKQSKKFTFFEIGKIFHKLATPPRPSNIPPEGNIFQEEKSVGAVIVNGDTESLRATLDGFIHTILPGMNFGVSQGTNVAHLHPNKSGTYTVDGHTLITFGSVHPAVAEAFGLSNEVVSFVEIDYKVLFEFFQKSGYVFQEISKYPGVRRELNFVLPERTPTVQIIKKIASTHSFLSDFSVVDIFRDETKIGHDKKSVTFSFLVQDSEKTLTDEAVLAIQNAIIVKMEGEGIELRK